MPSAAPFNMPGYSWDGTRFYKTLPGVKAPAAASPQMSSGRAKKKARRTAEKGKGRAVQAEPSLTPLRSIYDSHLPLNRPRRGMQHQLESLYLTRLSSTGTVYPDCLPIDEGISALSLSASSSVLRVGGSSGSIATGDLDRASDQQSFYPADELGWRTSWVLPARITSLHTCGDRMLATCLGPPAQAVVATTSESVSLASVTLSPRKTSLWTSALSPELVALGCDRKLLVTGDPNSSQMEGFVTGSQRGDGAVFALEISDRSVYAGTRRGEVRMFDLRSSRSRTTKSGGGGPPGRPEEETRAETQVSIGTSITHIKKLQEGLLVAGIDGSLGIYDTRYIASDASKPCVELKGHINSFSVDVGFSTWEDKFVAVAGQDHQVRIWSLRTGSLLPSTLPATSPTPAPSPPSFSPWADELTPPPSPTARTFSAPLKALQFAERGLLSSATSWRSRKDLERDGRTLRGGPVLWVGDGPGLECFEVQVKS